MTCFLRQYLSVPSPRAAKKRRCGLSTAIPCARATWQSLGALITQPILHHKTPFITLDTLIITLDTLINAFDTLINAFDTLIIALDTLIIALDTLIIAFDTLIITLDNRCLPTPYLAIKSCIVAFPPQSQILAT